MLPDTWIHSLLQPSETVIRLSMKKRPQDETKFYIRWITLIRKETSIIKLDLGELRWLESVKILFDHTLCGVLEDE